MSAGSIFSDVARLAVCLSVALALSGCAVPSQVEPDGNGAAGAVETSGLAAPSPPAGARTVEQFDTTTEAQRVAAASDAGGRLLGTTVASLGDASRAGFWIETPLVSERGTGHLVYPATGKSVEVELIPAESGGSRVSLAALRLLEAPLTDLPVLEVYEN